MTLLSKLIPAIRETRVPLLAGICWVLAGWVVWSGVDSNIAETIDGTPDPGSVAWRLVRASDVLSQLGAGIALLTSAYLVGTLTGWLWDSWWRRPLDERALRDRTAQLYSEAQLRIQMALPLAIIFIAFAFANPWFLVGLTLPAILAFHGISLWGNATGHPLNQDFSWGGG